MGRRLSRIVLVAAAWLGSLSPTSTWASAQAASATLSGTITDESGGVAPGVSVTIINLGTTLQRQTMTSSTGTFVFAVLPPGRYSLSAELLGFKMIEARDVVLNVGDRIGL